MISQYELMLKHCPFAVHIRWRGKESGRCNTFTFERRSFGCSSNEWKSRFLTLGDVQSGQTNRLGLYVRISSQ